MQNHQFAELNSPSLILNEFLLSVPKCPGIPCRGFPPPFPTPGSLRCHQEISASLVQEALYFYLSTCSLYIFIVSDFYLVLLQGDSQAAYEKTGKARWHNLK